MIIKGLVILIFLILLLIVWFYLFPVRYVRRAIFSEDILEPPDVYVYSYVIHIHTQFSYDSLGKPEDVIRVRDNLNIDYAIVTDHDNDVIKNFADERLIAGREIKINDEEGNLQGDLLEVGDLRIVVHHFREKYRWRLEKRRDYIVELIDLRDALLENKKKLILYILVSVFLYPLVRRRVVRNYAKLINIEGYVERFFKEGWRNKILGGLDHHVKFYIREVRKRIMIPSYEMSFSIMRNFVMTCKQIKDKEEFLKALKKGVNLISFSEKPSFVWIENGMLKAYSPFSNTYMKVISYKGEKLDILGSNLRLSDLNKGYYIVLGYTYAFRLGRMLFGVKPLFVSDLMEVS